MVTSSALSSLDRENFPSFVRIHGRHDQILDPQSSLYQMKRTLATFDAVFFSGRLTAVSQLEKLTEDSLLFAGSEVVTIRICLASDSGFKTAVSLFQSTSSICPSGWRDVKIAKYSVLFIPRNTTFCVAARISTHIVIIHFASSGVCAAGTADQIQNQDHDNFVRDSPSATSDATQQKIDGIDTQVQVNESFGTEGRSTASESHLDDGAHFDQTSKLDGQTRFKNYAALVDGVIKSLLLEFYKTRLLILLGASLEVPAGALNYIHQIPNDERCLNLNCLFESQFFTTFHPSSNATDLEYLIAHSSSLRLGYKAFEPAFTTLEQTYPAFIECLRSMQPNAKMCHIFERFISDFGLEVPRSGYFNLISQKFQPVHGKVCFLFFVTRIYL